MRSTRRFHRPEEVVAKRRQADSVRAESTTLAAVTLSLGALGKMTPALSHHCTRMRQLPCTNPLLRWSYESDTINFT
jgi:hypothetical protein